MRISVVGGRQSNIIGIDRSTLHLLALHQNILRLLHLLRVLLHIFLLLEARRVGFVGKGRQSTACSLVAGLHGLLLWSLVYFLSWAVQEYN